MNIVAVDDEDLALGYLESVITEAAPENAVYGFLTSAKALEFAKNNRVDVAFLDIKMPGMDGLSLAKEMTDIYDKTNIIFVTAYSDYALDAFSVYASGYVKKPVEAEDIKKQLENLRYPARGLGKRIRIQTFGVFEVFVDNRPLVFSRSKSKEALAYLVDRKYAGVTKKELANILWKGAEYSRTKQYQIQHIVSELIKTLREAGAEDILLKQRNCLSLRADSFDCDYYSYLAGEESKAFRGEYMANYLWGKNTCDKLKTAFVEGKNDYTGA